MKMVNTIAACLGMLFLFSQCGRSDEDRLAHKWIVQRAHHYYETGDFAKMSPDAQKQANAMSELINEEYAGCVYDLKEDGSFIRTHKGTTVSGQWSTGDDKVEFKVNDKPYEKWIFKHGVRVYANTSISPICDNGSAPIQYEMTPAPGQSIKTDF